jgi:hypothetical protein
MSHLFQSPSILILSLTSKISTASLVLVSHIKARLSALEGCRCQVRDKEEEDKDAREKMAELEELLRQSEIHRQDLEQQHRLKEQQFNAALSAATKVSAIIFLCFKL